MFVTAPILSMKSVPITKHFLLSKLRETFLKYFTKPEDVQFIALRHISPFLCKLQPPPHKHTHTHTNPPPPHTHIHSFPPLRTPTVSTFVNVELGLDVYSFQIGILFNLSPWGKASQTLKAHKLGKAAPRTLKHMVGRLHQRFDGLFCDRVL